MVLHSGTEMGVVILFCIPAGHGKRGVVWFCGVGYIGAREGRRGKRKGEGAAIA